MKILVLGSHPHCRYPDWEPDIVFAANGALPRTQRFDQAKIIWITSSLALCGVDSNLFGIIKGCRADECYILKGRNEIYQPGELINLKKRPSFVHRKRQVNWILQQVGWKAFVNQIHRMSPHKSVMRKLAETYLGEGHPWPRYISTGMFGVCCAMKRYRSADSIHLAGIGMDAGTGHYYDELRTYGSHLDMDTWYIRMVSGIHQQIKFTSDNEKVQQLIHPGVIPVEQEEYAL